MSGHECRSVTKDVLSPKPVHRRSRSGTEVVLSPTSVDPSDPHTPMCLMGFVSKQLWVYTSRGLAFVKAQLSCIKRVAVSGVESEAGLICSQLGVAINFGRSKKGSPPCAVRENNNQQQRTCILLTDYCYYHLIRSNTSKGPRPGEGYIGYGINSV